MAVDGIKTLQVEFAVGAGDGTVVEDEGKTERLQAGFVVGAPVTVDGGDGSVPGKRACAPAFSSKICLSDLPEDARAWLGRS